MKRMAEWERNRVKPNGIEWTRWMTELLAGREEMIPVKESSSFKASVRVLSLPENETLGFFTAAPDALICTKLLEFTTTLLGVLFLFKFYRRIESATSFLFTIFL